MSDKTNRPKLDVFIPFDQAFIRQSGEAPEANHVLLNDGIPHVIWDGEAYAVRIEAKLTDFA